MSILLGEDYNPEEESNRTERGGAPRELVLSSKVRLFFSSANHGEAHPQLFLSIIFASFAALFASLLERFRSQCPATAATLKFLLEST